MTNAEIVELTDVLIRAKIHDATKDFNDGTQMQFEAVVRELAEWLKKKDPAYHRERWVQYVLSGVRMTGSGEGREVQH